MQKIRARLGNRPISNSNGVRSSSESNSDSKPSCCDTLSWLTCVTVTVTLCIAHISICTKRYLDGPIAAHVQIHMSNTFKIPSVVICPEFNMTDEDNLAVMSNLKIFSENACKHDAGCDVEFRDQILPKLNELWNNSRIDGIFFTEKNCKHAVNIDVCKENAKNGSAFIQVTHPTTIFGGNCKQITQVDELRYSHKSKALNIKIKTSGNFVTFNFYDNLPLVTYDMFAVGDSISFNTRIWITDMRKFYYLNTKKNPCLPSEEARRRRQEKFEDRLGELDLCYLPMLNASRYYRECDSVDDVEKTLMSYWDFLTLDEIRLGDRSCELSIISYEEVSKALQNSSSIEFHLTENMEEVIREEYTYGLDTMLSDITGVLGFCLGLSLLHLSHKCLIYLKNLF